MLLYQIGPALAEARGEPRLAGLAAQQLRAFAVAVVAGLIAWRMPARALYGAVAERRYVILVFAAAVLCAVAALGTEMNGRRLWLAAWGLTLQPVEPLKVLIVLAAAAVLAETGERVGRSPAGRAQLRHALPYALALFTPLVALAVQGDFGPTLVLAPVGAVMYAAATRDLATPLLTTVLAAVLVAWLVMSGLAPPVVDERVAQWMDPFGCGETAARSLWTIAAGGLTGAGVAGGRPETIPLVHADYVFAAWAEKTGALGGLLLLAAVALFAWRALDVARAAPSRGLALTAAGLGLLMFVQAMVSAAGNLGLIAQTGITFPFVSHGGSSLVACFVAAGLVGSVARAARQQQAESQRVGAGETLQVIAVVQARQPRAQFQPVHTGAAERGRSLRAETFTRLPVAVLTLLIGAATVLRAVVQAPDLSARVYRAEPEHQWLERLIEGGGFGVDETGVVVVRERLAELEPSPAKARRAVELAAVLRAGGIRPVVPPAALYVADPRRREPIARGDIVDRHGRLLATDVPAGTGRKRVYPGGAADAAAVGVAAGIYAGRGAEATLASYLGGEERAPAFLLLRAWLRGVPQGRRAALTLDRETQTAAYRALDGRRGAVVALDVHTGAILALVSSPAFDPNTAAGVEWLAAERDPRRLFADRATRELYPPGSTFKVVTAAAALESGDDASLPEPGFVCSGYSARYRIRDIAPLGPVDLERALARSCNAYFAEVGNRVGRGLVETAARFGFGASIAVPGLAEPAVASRAIGERDQRFYERNPRLIAQAAIGQNLVSATPLQMAVVAAAVANGGWRVGPHLVAARALIDAGGAERRSAESTPSPTRALSEATAERLRQILGEAVRMGTGRGLPALERRPDGIVRTVPRAAGAPAGWGGKTGTAEVGDLDGDGHIAGRELPHAWMIGFAPLDDPQVAVAVLVENGGSGARVAGPIAAEMLAAALNALAPSPVPERADAGSARARSVTDEPSTPGGAG